MDDTTTEDMRADSAVTSALDVAALVIENGGTTFSGVRAFELATSAFGHPSYNLVVRLDALIASQAGRMTAVRPLQTIGTNLLRAQLARQLAARAAREPTTLAEFDTALRAIARSEPPYSGAQALVAVAVGSVTFSVLAGGDWGAAVIACFAGAGGRLARQHLFGDYAVAMSSLVAALVGALLAAIALRLRLSATPGPALLGSMMHLVPGVLLLNGVWDIATGRYLAMGVQRLTFAGMIFLGLGLALAAGAFIAGAR